jgi:hypothetical protein
MLDQVLSSFLVQVLVLLLDVEWVTHHLVPALLLWEVKVTQHQEDMRVLLQVEAMWHLPLIHLWVVVM